MASTLVALFGPKRGVRLTLDGPAVVGRSSSAALQLIDGKVSREHCRFLVDAERVSVEDLDAGMKHGAGWPMGPCTLLDLVGIDVHVHASEALYEKLREPRMAAPPRLVA